MTVFLDEAQNLDCFKSLLNGYLRKPNFDLYFSGSNAKFLFQDVIKEFAGRGGEISMTLFPCVGSRAFIPAMFTMDFPNI